jgi:hypothetical protein
MYKIFRFHRVFLTTAEDPNFKDSWLDLYSLRDTIIRITHNPDNHRSMIDKVIDLRNYHPQNSVALHCFDICSNPKKENADGFIHIFVGSGGQAVISQLQQLDQTGNIIFHFTGRYINPLFLKHFPTKHIHHVNVDAQEMIDIMVECHYFFYGMDNDNRFNKFATSGYVALALSCGTPIITTEYTQKLYDYQGFITYQENVSEILPLSVPDNSKILVEREKQIRLFDEALKMYFNTGNDSITEDLNISKILHFLGDNQYLDSWKRWYPDFTIKIWPRNSSNPSNILHKFGGIVILKTNLYCYSRLSDNTIIAEGMLIENSRDSWKTRERLYVNYQKKQFVDNLQEISSFSTTLFEEDNYNSSAVLIIIILAIIALIIIIKIIKR